jgi:uncharacterized protein (TIGR02147 family)
MELKLTAQLYLQQLVRTRFEEAKGKNRHFSLRAFSRKLKIPSSALSEFLNGKRRFSAKLASQILEDLALEPREKQKLEELFSLDNKTVFSEKDKLKLQADQYYLVADPIYYSILSLAETRDCKFDSKWIAERLFSSKLKVEVAVQRLLRLELLIIKDDKLLTTEKSLSTSEDIINMSLKKRQAQNLEAAKDSLYRDDVADRDFSSITMAIDPKKLPEAKKMIRAFRKKIMNLLEDKEKTEVYELCVQLFPRTKLLSQRKK